MVSHLGLRTRDVTMFLVSGIAETRLDNQMPWSSQKFIRVSKNEKHISIGAQP